MNWFIAVIFSMNLKIGRGFPIIENAPHLGMNDNKIIGNSKVLFANCCQWQNFRPSLLRLVNNCVESIYKTQNTRTKVLPSAMVGE